VHFNMSNMPSPGRAKRSFIGRPLIQEGAKNRPLNGSAPVPELQLIKTVKIRGRCVGRAAFERPCLGALLSVGPEKKGEKGESTRYIDGKRRRKAGEITK